MNLMEAMAILSEHGRSRYNALIEVLRRKLSCMAMSDADRDSAMSWLSSVGSMGRNIHYHLPCGAQGYWTVRIPVVSGSTISLRVTPEEVDLMKTTVTTRTQTCPATSVQITEEDGGGFTVVNCGSGTRTALSTLEEVLTWVDAHFADDEDDIEE